MTVELRPYQSEARDAIFGEFARGVRSTLLVLPTGLGKTVVFGAVARDVIDDGGRVLVLAHRGELLDQAADSLAALDVESSIEKAEKSARGTLWGDPACVVASVQTMQRKRLESWPRKHFKLIVTDEAHHAPADSYGHIYRHLDPDWHLGVTATADRLDGENLGQVYQSVAYEYSLRRAIEEGWLSRLTFVRCETTVDLRNIRTTGGDLNLGDLEEAIRPHVEELANATRKEIGDRRAIVFVPDVGSADAFASALTSLGMKAEAISGDSSDRGAIIDRFRTGGIRVLVNCQLLTEGFDAPFVSAIVLARPTKSRALFSQMIGRGTRLSHGKKDCIVVDFAWLTCKHNPVSPVELFDTTKMDREVQELAAAMVESGESPDLMDAIERAEATHVERQRLRIRARERESRYRRVAYDPFAVMDTLGMASRAEAESSLRIKPTDKQIATLEKLGVTDARTMSKRRASQMLDVLFSRMDKKLATLKQVAHLIANGVDPDEARAMTKDEASARLDVLFGKAVSR
jgi:superfamily II DNA or RNA helicase